MSGRNAWVTLRERREVWQQLHEQVARLGLDGGTAGKLMTALQARVPLPTVEETGAAELAEAERDAALWDSQHRQTLKIVEVREKMVAHAESKLAEERDLAKAEAERAEQAKAKAARLANYRGGG